MKTIDYRGLFYYLQKDELYVANIVILFVVLLLLLLLLTPL
jgi:hypothetical protein